LFKLESNSFTLGDIPEDLNVLALENYVPYLLIGVMGLILDDSKFGLSMISSGCAALTPSSRIMLAICCFIARFFCSTLLLKL
jgi:hypothetical protein